MLETNEIILHEQGQWLHFKSPMRVISAIDLADVLPALREIEQLVDTNGWHAVGFLSYEAAPAFDSALQVRPAADFPLLWFGLYPPPDSVTLPAPHTDDFSVRWQQTVKRQVYNAAIAQIKEYIAQGKTYQVNYTMRLRADFKSDPWELFLRLAQAQNAGYEAFLHTDRWIIASASPELFFTLDGNTITGRPMKGTVKRGRTTSEDKAQAEWLHNSIKNRAENVMIVDMIRNDLGRIAEIGSVQVPELFSTERYPTLWQMTSTVTAQSKESLTTILSSLFPCASITGAPKASTMRIIAELETNPRRIYTGSIGHIAPGRKAQFNVAIRTVLLDCETGEAEYGLGGGIVWDSTSADEYAEALLKARVLTERRPEFSLFETLLWTPAEGWFLRERHLARLLDSASYFGIPASVAIINARLDSLVRTFYSSQRVRLLLGRDGRLTAQSSPFVSEQNPPALTACLATKPVNSSDVFLFHKTTQRATYESAKKACPGYDDVLLYNERGQLTEFTIGNLVVEMNGVLYTPPVKCGLLPGTFRAYLLETGQVKERILRKKDLALCTKIFLVNSVRKWREVTIRL
jgi:para-aminobenzoate synthetase/4-amino-4-deoxychorismate lyase